MKVPGYCERCHRIRQVRVSGHGLAMMAATKGVATGICDACQDEEDRKRRISR